MTRLRNGGRSAPSVVTLTGGVNTYVHMIGGLNPALARTNRLFMVPSPLVVSSAATAAALLREPAVCDVLTRAHAADYALIGIGAMNETASFVKGGYVSTAEMVRYRRPGAVGDVLGRFLDEAGRVLDLEIHERIVGTDLATLGTLACVIGVAGGPQKTTAIRSVLAIGTLDMMITDESSAVALLG